MLRLLATPLVALSFSTAIQPLPAPLKAQLKGGYWRAGCPVALTQLRLLTVKTWGFDGKARTGQLVVNEKAAAPLQRVFAKLYQLHFPIRHMQLSDAYVSSGSIPDTDITASFECRQASASPCTGKTSTGIVVEPCLRARGRHQPEREPLRRLRDDAGSRPGSST